MSRVSLTSVLGIHRPFQFLRGRWVMKGWLTFVRGTSNALLGWVSLTQERDKQTSVPACWVFAKISRLCQVLLGVRGLSDFDRSQELVCLDIKVGNDFGVDFLAWKSLPSPPTFKWLDLSSLVHGQMTLFPEHPMDSQKEALANTLAVQNLFKKRRSTYAKPYHPSVLCVPVFNFNFIEIYEAYSSLTRQIWALTTSEIRVSMQGWMVRSKN